MKKLPKFMICENPLADYGQEYILHTQKPRILFKVVEESDGTSFEVADHYDPLPEKKRLDGLIDRLSDWFFAYCDWEENEAPHQLSDDELPDILEPKLEDAHAMSLLHKSTFQAPANKDLEQLQADDFVKVNACGERFWCRVMFVDFPDMRLVAQVDNELELTDDHNLKLGDVILIGFHNIYQIQKNNDN